MNPLVVGSSILVKPDVVRAKNLANVGYLLAGSLLNRAPGHLLLEPSSDVHTVAK